LVSPTTTNPPKTFGKSIKIEGDKKFQKKTIKDLEDLKKTPTGKNLLESLDDSGKQVTIKPVANSKQGNSCGYINPSGRFTGSDGKPGKGTDSIVSYNPDRKKIGNQKWEKRPPAIGLAHELIHADQAAHGTMSLGEADNDSKKDPSDPTKFAKANLREIEAVGIPPNDKRDFTENKIRSEWDPKQPERKWY
jgi:type VI secretion system secreted protein VgrG